MSVRQLLRVIQEHQHFGIISHYRPDGDAIGSTLALGCALRDMGKSVWMWNEDGVPSRYAFLEGASLISPVPEGIPEELEVLICLDTGEWKRIGDVSCELFRGFPLIVNIDHHATNTHYGHLNIVEAGTAACGYVLFQLLTQAGVEMTPAIASALYVAISTDTGSFQYASTTPDVMRAAAELLADGVDVADVNRRLYQEIPLTTLQVNREVLNHMVVEEDGLIAHYSLPAGTRERMGISLEDTKDLVDIIRVIRGVRAAVIFEDMEDGRIRVSLRSKDSRLSVAEVASLFGGGGHAMAAGIRMRGRLEDCRSAVLDALRAAVRSLPHE